jgi:hypothetical protein
VNALNVHKERKVHGSTMIDEVWSVLERCWKATASDRPRTADVLLSLEKVSVSWSPSQTMNSDSSAHDDTDKCEVPSPPHAIPPEPLSGLPSVGERSTAPGVVGAHESQKAGIVARESHDPGAPRGTVEKVCVSFSDPRKCVTKSLLGVFERRGNID